LSYLANTQTDRQTKSGKNIISLAEIKKYATVKVLLGLRCLIYFHGHLTACGRSGIASWLQWTVRFIGQLAV